ncbi:hypothetical protein IWW42_002736 [Coemansia sp. RSA 1085]|nr:hypothetical protein IWW42_002736 [Coemansia sp. RSA 1085]
MATEKCTLIPEQLFESQETFIAHVKRFAVENGFNVRLDDVERDKGGAIRKRDIVCSSEGAPRGKDAKREESARRSEETEGTRSVAHSGAHRRKSMKTGCRWLARASRQPSGMWKMIMLRLEHNHPLAARYDLVPIPAVRTGEASLSAAALAARSAVENGTYQAAPSPEFRALFLQMMAACTDLCWSAARHPDTIAEVLSEVRRLSQHLEKHAAPDAPAEGSLVMMGPPATAETPAQVIAQSQSRAPEAARSPELAGPAAGMAGAAASPAQATGPIKRARGRPRKNPLEAKAARAKPKRDQPAAASVATPTPASLASLSQQIISQNAASPVSAQRPISSLALPPQPLQSHMHRPAAEAEAAHRPQQSPTFFLGAAEGNGYSEHAAKYPAVGAQAAKYADGAQKPPAPASFPAAAGARPVRHILSPADAPRAAVSAISDPSANASSAVSQQPVESPLHQGAFPHAYGYYHQHPHYHGQLSRMQPQDSAAAAAQAMAAGHRAPMFHLNQPSYLLMSRAQQQQPQAQQAQAQQAQQQAQQAQQAQQPKQPNEHLAAIQSSPTQISALPSMSPAVAEHSRRIDELQQIPYQNMSHWQM